MKMAALIATFCLFASPDALAETLTGTVINDNVNAMKLVVSTVGSLYAGQTLTLDCRADLMVFLKRLHTGDSITARGNYSNGLANGNSSVGALVGVSLSSDLNSDAIALISEKHFTIDSIDQVGLTQLLGTWRSSRWEIFEFQDFSQLNLYMPEMQNQGNISLAKTHSLKYIVTPDAENRFAIFMNDDRDVRMGFIELGPNQVTLTINDFYTGQVSENISLSPLNPQ
jgi:hypothetical protein